MVLPLTPPQQLMLDTISRDEGKKIITNTIKNKLNNQYSNISKKVNERNDHLEQILKDGGIIKHNPTTGALESTKQGITKTIEEQVNNPLSNISKGIAKNLETAGQALNDSLKRATEGLGFAKKENVDKGLINVQNKIIDLNDRATTLEGNYTTLNHAITTELPGIRADLTNLNTRFTNYRKHVDNALTGLDTRVSTLDGYHNALNDHINSKLPGIEAKIDAQIGDNPAARTALETKITNLLNTNYYDKTVVEAKLDELELELNEDDRKDVAIIMELIGQLKTEVASVTAEIGKYKDMIIQSYGKVLEGYKSFEQKIGNMRVQKAPKQALQVQNNTQKKLSNAEEQAFMQALMQAQNAQKATLTG